MTPYQAVMAAADHIETNPKEFDFSTYTQPKAPNCGTPGCALGWIATFGKVPSENFFPTSAVGCWDRLELSRFMRDSEFDERSFYKRMNALAPALKNNNRYEHCWQAQFVWTQDPKVCADTLRKYAQKYLAPVEQPVATESEVPAHV